MFYSILTRKCDSTGGGLTHYGTTVRVVLNVNSSRQLGISGPEL